MHARTITALYMTACLLVAGSYGMILMLPLRLAEIGGSAVDVGRLHILIGGTAITGILLSGYVSDRIGQLRSLGLAAAFIAVALVLFGMSRGIGMLPLAASLTYGSGWGLYFGLKLAVLARITTPESRFRSYALLSVAIMLGFGLWPVGGAVLTHITGTTSVAYYVAAGLSAVGGVLYLALRSPSQKLAPPGKRTSVDALTRASVRSVVGSPALLPIALTFLTACIFAGMNSFQTIYAQERGLDFAEYFLAYTLSAVGFRLLSSPWITPANAWWATVCLYAIMSGAILLFVTSGNSQILYLLVAIGLGLGYGVSSPIVQTLCANAAPSDSTAQSLQMLVICHLAGVFGFPLIAGALLVSEGAAAVIYLLTAISVLATLGAFYALFFDRKRARKTSSITTTHQRETST